MTIPILLLFLSFALLYYGAEFALDGSEKIGERLGMSPLLIGMLLVGIGTSLPELFVSHIAVVNNKPDIAMGGLIGSNIANIYLILGICTFLTPLAMGSDELRPQFIMHTLLYIITAPLLLMSKTFGYLGAAILLGYIFVYLVGIYKQMRKDSKTDPVNKEDLPDYNYFIITLKMLIGFALLYYGGDLLVSSGTTVCKKFGISEYIISAILVAFGTSFPELVTALLAAYRKKDQDLIVGNIIGSNVFNVGLILGSLGFYKIPINMKLGQEMLFLVVVSIYFIVLNIKKAHLNKFAGVLFLFMYAKMVFYWVRS